MRYGVRLPRESLRRLLDFFSFSFLVYLQTCRFVLVQISGCIWGGKPFRVLRSRQWLVQDCVLIHSSSMLVCWFVPRWIWGGEKECERKGRRSEELEGLYEGWCLLITVCRQGGTRRWTERIEYRAYWFLRYHFRKWILQRCECFSNIVKQKRNRT